MRISRDAIVEMLEERGLHDRAKEAGDRLSPVIETENDLGLLSEFGIAADDLVGGLGEVATDDKDVVSDEDLPDEARARGGEGRQALDEDEREAAGDQQERT